MKEFVIGAAALAAVGPVLAQTTASPAPPAPQVQPVPQIDRVAPLADRVHTRDEVIAKVRRHFAELDTNRDGVLTREEADAGRAMIRERIVERVEKRSGERSAAAFDRMDANKDGMISRDEFEKAREVRVERRIERLSGDGRDGASATVAPRMMRMHRMGMVGGHMFDMADANKDGRVTLQEAQDAAVRHFDMADSNRDGRLTREERRQMRRQMVIRHRTPESS